MIRFTCPQCKSILTGRPEHAGKSVACPKCRQRVQLPRTASEPIAPARKQSPTPPKSHGALVGVLAVVAVLLLVAAGGGVWLLVRSSRRETEPIVAANESAPRSNSPSTPSSKRTPPAPQPEKRVPVADNPAEPNPPPPPKPPEDKPVGEQPPPLPPPVKEKKVIELADDSTPELSFDLVDAINVQRQIVGLEPIFLDEDLSRRCQAQAEALARRGQPLPYGRGSDAAPLAAIENALKEPFQRRQLLEPRLRTFGAGWARNVKGQWVSVFDWTHGLDQGPPLDRPAITPAVVYPAPGQQRVPLWFPGNETPDPLPDAVNKLAGYPITLIFPPRLPVTEVRARLSSADEADVAVWLSTPDKPANPDPRLGNLQQNTICLIAKQPLRPRMRYHVEVSAQVNGKPWSAKWDFATLCAGEIHHDVAGRLPRRLNALRQRAGLPLVPLNAGHSKACAAHARYLLLNAPVHRRLNWNEEKPDLPGYTVEGAAIAGQAYIQGGGGPVEAVNNLIDSLISRPHLLDSSLREIALGYTPFPLGGWLWVIELRSVPDRNGESKECLYPAPDQRNVPLVYPPREIPSPIPAGSKAKAAGYALTAAFGERVRVQEATAKLVDDKGAAVDGWLSTPDKPAISDFSQRCLCFLPSAPLRPATRYTITFRAEVNARTWERTWNFTTVAQPKRFDDNLDVEIVAQLNAVRRAAGLRPVRLDPELSRGCQSHGHYLELNENNPAGNGMAVHREDAALPGATPEGAAAAKKSVIAMVRDPRTCIDDWMATLYHRIPLLAPNLERVGFGHAPLQGRKWACVLDTGNGRSSPPPTRPRLR